MSKMKLLPMADFLCKNGQTSAYIRSHHVSWEIPTDNQYYLEYSYNRINWYALNGGCAVTLPREELPLHDAILSQNPEGTDISIAALESLKSRYGAPEPVCISAVEEITSPADHVQVVYTNGMTEARPVIWDDAGSGHIQEPEYPAPIISHRADPYIYKHTDGKYYFIGSHTDAGHNLNGQSGWYGRTVA